MTVSKAAHAQHAIPLQIIYRHTNLFHYFPSLTQALEVLFVLEGIKPAAQQLIHNDNLAAVRGFCQNMKLGFASSPSGTGWHLAMLAENQDVADHALFYAHIGNHARLGDVLGYPSCCVGNYLDHIRRVASEEEYALLSPQHDNRIPFVMNYLLRSHDLSLLSHVPCSFLCVQSIKQADKSHATLKKYNPQLADYLQGALRGPVIVHQHAAHPLRDYSIVGDDVYYKHVLPTKENHMHDVFSLCNKVQVVQPNHVKLCQGDHVVDELHGDHVRFLMFE
ncbi:DUF483 domain-containing protein [Candidatus Woesearchaeota archaeon]|nr:DUF483 domain-containing protein [Candidatus Woesearchaeota archaeon]